MFVKRVRICLLLVATVVSVACTSKEESSKLDLEIQRLEAQSKILEGKLELLQSGGLLHTLTSLERQIVAQTIAMVRQRREAVFAITKLTYTVDGKVYAPPADLEARKAELTQKIEEGVAQQRIAEIKAESTSGLLGKLAELDVASKAILVSQLKYQLVAYEIGFPPFWVPVDEVTGPVRREALTMRPDVAGVASKSALYPREESISKETVSTEKAVGDLDQMRSVLDVKLMSTKYTPSDIRSGRYEEFLSFGLEAHNLGDRGIRAFQGVLEFKDLFGNALKDIRITWDKKIPAQTKLINSDYGLSVNKFSDEDKRLVATEYDNIKFGFVPVSILFDDGSQIGEKRE